MNPWLDIINWNDDGLIPVIVQEVDTKQILMHAWMNRASLEQTFQSGKATYWSRSRKKQWVKGESSGHYQFVESIHTDCDNDVLLITVKQKDGIACHTGRYHCFFRKLEEDHWVETEKILKSPEDIYGKQK
tara:strand:- start:194 stop:586 length:393 start_codon:yes stop_codon:yes gene_type:complete